MGKPDFDLEKFAINSLISATHSSQMDEEDKNDIIKKINTSGSNDDTSVNDTEKTSTNDGDELSDNNETSVDDNSVESDSNEVTENEFFLDKPKKNNMFQPNSNNILKKDLQENKKSCTFDKKFYIKNINEMLELEEPLVKPKVLPKETPITTPRRKNKPFLPMPDVEPRPKAKY